MPNSAASAKPGALAFVTAPGGPDISIAVSPRMPAASGAAPALFQPPPPAVDDSIVQLALLQSSLASGAMSFLLNTAPGSVAQSASPTPRLTDSRSDQAMNADVARANYGVQGRGITIGIMSDSFNRLGGAAADVAAGNLPAEGVRILREGGSGGHDEGRAMADLVHRVAPDAHIVFATATAGEASFASGILALQQAGCNIIVDDVSYFDEPFFQDGGAVQAAVQSVVGKGVNYFTSASNEGQNFIEAPFTGIRAAIPGLPSRWTVENFGTAAQPAAATSVTVPTNGSVTIALQWDQPFASIGGGAGAASSLAMALLNASGRIVAITATSTLHADPSQVLRFTNTGAATGFRLVVFSNSAFSLPHAFKTILYGNGALNDPIAGHGSGTVTGHELSAGANTVGAEAWSSTPRFGGNGQVEGFSSVGSGRLLFDSHGNRLAQPVDTGKVSFVAPDGSSTSTLAPFYGTSAAAPNAAAVAALMLEANPFLTPAQVTNLLQQSAVPATAAAGSGGTGAGLIQADSAVALAYGLLHPHA